MLPSVPDLQLPTVEQTDERGSVAFLVVLPDIGGEIDLREAQKCQLASSRQERLLSRSTLKISSRAARASASVIARRFR